MTEDENISDTSAVTVAWALAQVDDAYASFDALSISRALGDLELAVLDFIAEVNDYDKWQAMLRNYGEEPQPGFSVATLRKMLGYGEEEA